MKILRLLSFLSICVFILSCSSSKHITAITVPSISGLKCINEYVVPNNLQFKGTTIGGLSGIDYDSARGLYYIICDDRSERNPARFYTAKIIIGEKGIDNVEFTDVISLLNWADKPFPSNATTPAKAPDPESIRYYPRRNCLVWGNEGERIVKTGDTVLQNPSINRSTLKGGSLTDFEINLEMQTIEKGPRRNGVFEGLAFSGDYRYLYASIEEPLYQDGPRAGSGDSTAWVRFLKCDPDHHGHVIAQYAYQIDALPYAANPPGAFKVNGVSEIMYVAKDQLLVIERAFITGRNSNSIRIYLADLSQADNIRRVSSLYPDPTVRPIAKKLLLNMDDLGRYIDNVEGVSFGPLLPNGHRSLIFVTDNNFDTKQKTQFFLFEVLP